LGGVRVGRQSEKKRNKNTGMRGYKVRGGKKKGGQVRLRGVVGMESNLILSEKRKRKKRGGGVSLGA